MANPYNCTEPGRLFVGYRRELDKMLNGFVEMNSYALLGGRRCGKTSFLRQIERRLHDHALPGYNVNTAFLSLQQLGRVTTPLLFEKLYELVVQGAGVPIWRPKRPEREYEDFLDALENASSALDARLGPNWFVVIILDEIDRALSDLNGDDTFFQNLRHLLMDSPLRRHLRLVLSGVRGLASLITSGSSPLNNLRHIYLGALPETAAKELVGAGFAGNSLGCEIEVLRLTGRHPYLMQGLLEKLYDEFDCRGGELGKKEARSAAQEFLLEHNDFVHWTESFEEAGRAVYRYLSDCYEGRASLQEVKRGVPIEFRTQVADALTVLEYHGVVDGTNPDEPELIGTIFRDWFRERHSVSIGDSAKVVLSERAPQSDPHNPQVIVTVNNELKQENRQTTGAEMSQIMELIEGLLLVNSQLPNNMESRSAELEIKTAELELKKAELTGRAVNTGMVEKALKVATNTLKSAGATADAMAEFKEKAEKIVRFLSMAAGWLT